MMQFLSPASLDQVQLDIVGFLAILGEGSVLANAQVSTLSKWIFLPRLIPAPQALLRPTRPSHLESHPGQVTGVLSGNDRPSINHIGNIVCDANNSPEFSVRVVTVRRNSENPLKFKTIAPLTLVLLLGFALSILLLALSIQRQDGFSLVATLLLSFLSTLIGWGNKWTLQLPQRRVQNGKVPRGDVVIRYPKGNFLIVRCEENVARELYFAPETVKYLLQHAPAYRILSLVGTMMLMGGVICLANAKIELQIAWAGAYMFLGAGYWTVAALPSKMHWDTSCYTVDLECLSDSTLTEKGMPSLNKTFTQALWKAIVVTKSIDWVSRSGAAPNTDAWRQWLRDARHVANTVRFSDEPVKPNIPTWVVPDWDPQEHLKSLLEEQATKDEKSGLRSV